MVKFFSFQSIKGAGHHVYADNPEVFNKYVTDACLHADKYKSTFPAIQGSDNTESDAESDASTSLPSTSSPTNVAGSPTTS